MAEQKYYEIDIPKYPKTPWEQFKRVVQRSLRIELFKGMKIVFGVMYRALFKNEMHTFQYPIEKIQISQRYRAIHKLLRFMESENERCIGCGLCEKICPAKCIRMDTTISESGRKQVSQYTINFGRCIYCGYCADVCPELAIVHGNRYENATEQRAHFALKEDMLTPLERLKEQKEFPGFGAVSQEADNLIKKTPLAY
jgi:NADH-quinone oxidoreductase subunit I